ncbi:hypothetical protein VC36_29735 [Pseudomonas marginalis]|nr:hypothetical protein VC36_29735 [Pseudomonas marginalis]VVO30373.1 hypothetical protein PS720_04942 [Pseudomonas fluorescens]
MAGRALNGCVQPWVRRVGAWEGDFGGAIAKAYGWLWGVAWVLQNIAGLCVSWLVCEGGAVGRSGGVHIRCCGNGGLGFRSYSGSLLEERQK